MMKSIHSNRAVNLQLDRLFKDKYEQGLFDGNVLVAHKGEIIFSGSYGWECYEKKIPLSLHSRFELASVTKPITALGIKLLIRKSMLKENDALSNWIPDFPYPEVTIEHALTHTSGLPDYMALLEDHWDHARIAKNPDALWLLAEHKPPQYFAPGSGFRYSNTAYMCLALVIEAVSGLSYADFMRSYVFEPAGMTDSMVISRRLQPELTAEKYAFGYIRLEDGRICLPDELPVQQYVRYLDGIQGDGTVHSTVLDLLRLDQAIRNGVFSDLQDSIVDSNPEWLAPIDSGTGRRLEHVIDGWFAERSSVGGRMLGHSGGWPGYATRMCRYMDSGHTIILLCNVEPLDYRTRAEQPEDWQLQIEQLLMR
ncbi:beta-lactamase family protein [Paenibacillus sp. GSMTC-2017]|uniref:serine hydrolase domain-containing protein n=1 Tax=Paenibacillus sp. GSMTC-2017 TaxID=2794350 RepID=UPI0018D76FB4|nr:serine hydrolase domain-containing protein [Paenibacillus sp. GSMTC-2017]MBH5318750.1 beta-lactamase family protein [Paenibacillus sp. GSMTC-2017]